MTILYLLTSLFLLLLVALPTQQQTLRPPLEPPSTDFECQRLDAIEMCTLIYDNASFPNFRGHADQNEANSELLNFTPLIRRVCSNAIVHFLCPIYAPYCQFGREEIRIRPCRELCAYVRSTCEQPLNEFGLQWPPHLECDNFLPDAATELDFCPPNITLLQIPPNVVTDDLPMLATTDPAVSSSELPTTEPPCPEIIQPPENATVALGQGPVSLTCRVRGNNIFLRVNGAIFNHNNLHLFRDRGITFSNPVSDNVNKIITQTVTVTSTMSNNGTRVICYGTSQDQDQPVVAKSYPAMIFFAGVPLPPEITYSIVDHFTLNVQWEVPYTFEGFPVIEYIVSVNNTIDSSSQSELLFSGELSNETLSFNLTHNDSTTCTNLTFVVVARNSVGLSEPGIVYGAFPARPGNFSELPNSEVTFSQDQSVILQINFTFPTLCPYNNATYQLVIVDDADSIVHTVGPTAQRWSGGDAPTPVLIRETELQLDAFYSVNITVWTLVGQSSISFMFNTIYNPDEDPVVSSSELPTTEPPCSELEGSLLIQLNGETYPSDSTIPITDVGAFDPSTGHLSPDSSLVCVTSELNTQCCRTRDGGNVGEWLFPNGTMVPRNKNSPDGDFTRSGYRHQVRLSRKNNAISPSGTFTCLVPREDGCGGYFHAASITLSLPVAALLQCFCSVCVWDPPEGRIDISSGYDIRYSVLDTDSELIRNVIHRRFFLATPPEVLGLGPQEQIFVEVRVQLSETQRGPWTEPVLLCDEEKK